MVNDARGAWQQVQLQYLRVQHVSVLKIKNVYIVDQTTIKTAKQRNVFQSSFSAVSYYGINNYVINIFCTPILFPPLHAKDKLKRRGIIIFAQKLYYFSIEDGHYY
mgnify:CR=1 FL=1